MTHDSYKINLSYNAFFRISALTTFGINDFQIVILTLHITLNIREWFGDNESNVIKVPINETFENKKLP